MSFLSPLFFPSELITIGILVYKVEKSLSSIILWVRGAKDIFDPAVSIKNRRYKA